MTIQDDKYYMKKFANFTTEAQIDILCKIFKIDANQSEIILSKIISEMKKQETLFFYAHQKRELSKSNVQRIEAIKRLNITKKKQHKEGKIHFLIRTRFFAEIEKLRQENISWRKISDYIKKVYKKKIPYQTLYVCYYDIKKQIDDKQ